MLERGSMPPAARPPLGSPIRPIEDRLTVKNVVFQPDPLPFFPLHSLSEGASSAFQTELERERGKCRREVNGSMRQTLTEYAKATQPKSQVASQNGRCFAG